MSLCSFQVKLLTWLDWFGTTRMVPFEHPEAAPYTAGIDRAELSAAIHCVRPPDRLWKGARALRRIGAGMPLLWLPVLLLWIPGIIWLAEIVYAWVSRRRLTLSKVFGCEGACTIMPERQRSDDVIGEDTAVEAHDPAAPPLAGGR